MLSGVRASPRGQGEGDEQVWCPKLSDQMLSSGSDGPEGQCRLLPLMKPSAGGDLAGSGEGSLCFCRQCGGSESRMVHARKQITSLDAG